MKINQVIAVEKTTKNRVEDAFTAVLRQAEKADLFEGLSRTYRPAKDGGEQLPSESKKLQLNAQEVLEAGLKTIGELMDVTARKDYSNVDAKADVVVGTKTIVKDAPITFLLFLEKKLIDYRTFALAIPTLDPAEDWTFDKATNVSRAAVKSTHRTKKEVRVIVKYDATPEHPAQTDLFNEDVIVGFWETQKISGAMTVPDKKKLVERIEKLQAAVKVAREEANSAAAKNVSVSDALNDYLLNG